ncbi:MAG: hypothetical protein E6Q50_14450 [Lysobacter sp.]|nr:MAG: hypothetical protein E6Q50_14450 [Lysobacter sp.]
MNTDTSRPDLETRNALRHGASALAHMREALEAAALAISRYEEQYREAADLGQNTKVLNWAINHVCTSVLGNVRIDLAADAQAELNAIAKRTEEA